MRVFFDRVFLFKVTIHSDNEDNADVRYEDVKKHYNIERQKVVLPSRGNFCFIMIIFV